MKGIWEMKTFVRDEGMKGITLCERPKLPARCSVLAKRRDTGTEIFNSHLCDGVTSTNI
jgi:hypothetical protein